MDRLDNDILKSKSESARRTLFSEYKNGARRRNLEFNLTTNQFSELTKQNCWYCGIEPSQIKYSSGHKRYYCFYNGIDRVNNTVGYVEANCIPCCGQCNRMKNVLHAEDFIIHIRKIAHNLNIL